MSATDEEYEYLERCAKLTRDALEMADDMLHRLITDVEFVCPKSWIAYQNFRHAYKEEID